MKCFKTLNKIYNYCNENLFFVFIVTCLIFLLCYGLYLKLTGKKGSWSKDYFDPFKDLDDEKRKNKYEQKGESQEPDVKKSKTDSSGELETRRCLEEIFGKPFDKARPYFLNNPVTGGIHNLELDCFNPGLKLAVEYQGKMHYKYIPFFHKTKDSFLNGRYRDELKRRMCKDNMITLIEVPYTVKNENIKDYLIKELFKHGYIMK